MTELNEDKLPEIEGLVKSLTKEAKSAGFSILVYVEGPEVHRYAERRYTRKYVFYVEAGGNQSEPFNRAARGLDHATPS